MIYQLQAYYGAKIDDKVIYSAVLSFDDCTKLLTKLINTDLIKENLIQKIIKDGFNPDDFIFDWLTKVEYENKVESKIVEEFNC